MNKKTLTLGGILIVLIALAFLYNGPIQKWKADMSKPKNLISKIDVDSLSKIEITRNSSTATFIKKNDKWQYNDGKIAVNQTLLDELIKSLKEAKNGDMELVSSNKSRKKDFQTDDSGIKVKLSQGEKNTVDIVVGKQSSDFTDTYFSRNELSDTYAIKVSIVPFLTQHEWRDTTIFKSDKAKIDKIRFQFATSEFTVEKKNSKWQGTLPVKFKVNPAKLNKILDLFSTLNTDIIPEQTFKGTGLDKHAIIVAATGDGISNVLMVGDAKDKSKSLYYAKKGDSDAIYTISKAQKDILDIRMDDLK